MAFSGEIVSTAPYYQNIRKHSTLSGDILCTGAGCVGCSPEKNGDESIVRLLGDVDSVNFRGKNGNQKKLYGKRPVTAPGCHGDETGKSNEEENAPVIKINKPAKNSWKGKQGQKNILKKRNSEKHRPNGKIINDTKRLGKNAPQDFEPPRRQKQVSFKCRLGETENIRKPTTIDQRRSLYNTFPGRVAQHHKNPLTAKNNSTSFLEMLKSSESGIYDMRILERNDRSIWIEKIKEKGVSEEELLPQIARSLITRNSGDGSEREMADKHIQTIKTDRTIKHSLPHVSLNNRVQTRGGESILVIEHEHEAKKKTDATLYRLGFLAETSLSHRKFPKVSIVEIAEALGEFVNMGAIKVIQRRNKKWIVLVEGKSVKEFLLENGLVLGGRHFEMFEMKTF